MAGRFVIWGKALIAVMAIGLAASSAKADLAVTFQDVTSGGTTYTQSIGGLSNGSTGAISVGDFTGTYTVHYTDVNGYQAVSLDITATNNSSTSSDLRSIVSNGSVTTPSSIVGTSATLGAFVNVTGSTQTAGSMVTEEATYIPGTGSSVSTSTGVMLSAGSETGSASSSTSIPSLASSYELDGFNVDYSANGRSTISYSAGAFVAPEPSGIAAAMAGLPCMGALLGFVRRRRLAVSAAVAQ